MANVQSFDTRFVLSDGTLDPLSGRAAGFINSAAPILIGLIAPVLMLLLIDPHAVWYAPFLLPTVLFPLAAFSIAVYMYCVLNPGNVVAVVADPVTRTLELVQSNFFATRRTKLGFDEIATLRLSTEYDQDGYSAERAELHLQNGERVHLPSVTDKAEVLSLRSVLGLR